MTEPKAEKVPTTLEEHGNKRVDNYFWMRLSDAQKEAAQMDEQTEKVVNYLNEENDFLDAGMKHTEALQEKLFKEITGRIKQDDESVPVKKNGYFYYNRFEKGQDYPFVCRKKDDGKDKEEIMLNGPKIADGKSYLGFGGSSVSPNNNLLAYGLDFVSRRQYTIYFKDLNTGKMLEDKIENTTGGAVWANDNKTIYYVKKDPQTLRSAYIYSHVLGTSSDEDKLVYHEKDETFGCSVYKSKSEAYIMIGSFQTLSTEIRFIDANNPQGEWKVVLPRERNHEYSVDHYGDHFYITTNDGAKNFKLIKTPVSKTGREYWEEVYCASRQCIVGRH